MPHPPQEYPSFNAVPGVRYARCLMWDPRGDHAYCSLWGDPASLPLYLHRRGVYLSGRCVSAAGVDRMVATLQANPQITTLCVDGPDLTGLRVLIQQRLQEAGIWVRTHATSGDFHGDVHWLTRGRAPVIGDFTVAADDVLRAPGPPGRSYVGRTLWAVWPRVLGEIVRHGTTSPTSYGNAQRELLSLTWTFNAASTLLHVPDWMPLDTLPGAEGDFRQRLDAYAEAHFLGTAPAPEGVSYVYADRLRKSFGDDQIQACIDALRENPGQRRALASTWDGGNAEARAVLKQAQQEYDRGAHDGIVPALYEPATAALAARSDATKRDPPCFVSVWFRQDARGRLYTHALFRSHDMLRAAVGNAWGLCRLAQHVAEELGWPPGQLTITSLSAHVYDDGWALAEELAQARGRAAAVEDDDRTILDVQPYLDPAVAEQGVEIIRYAPDGTEVATIRAPSAERAIQQALEQGWVSTLSHAAWLGRVATAAQTALAFAGALTGVRQRLGESAPPERQES